MQSRRPQYQKLKILLYEGSYLKKMDITLKAYIKTGCQTDERKYADSFTYNQYLCKHILQ